MIYKWRPVSILHLLLHLYSLTAHSVVVLYKCISLILITSALAHGFLLFVPVPLIASQNGQLGQSLRFWAGRPSTECHCLLTRAQVKKKEIQKWGKMRRRNYFHFTRQTCSARRHFSISQDPLWNNNKQTRNIFVLFYTI